MQLGSQDSPDCREGRTPYALIRLPLGRTEMVALTIGRCQICDLGTAVTVLSPVDITPSRLIPADLIN